MTQEVDTEQKGYKCPHGTSIWLQGDALAKRRRVADLLGITVDEYLVNLIERRCCRRRERVGM
jgi:hypothetical protein